MNQLYQTIYQLSFNGGKTWHHVSIYKHFNYGEMPETTVTNFETFEEAYSAVANGHLVNAFIDGTIFGHKPMVRLTVADKIENIKLTEKNFKPFMFRTFYRPIPDRIFTYDDLSRCLPCDEFVQWQIDKGLTF